MKSLFTLLLAALAFVATAQPQKIHYQGVAVGANGKPIKNSAVGLRLSVLDSLPTGTTLYTETQSAGTDASGQFSIYLGGGTATAGTFSSLPWANGNDKFLKVEMDAQGGTNYLLMGTTQFVCVPYAMAASSLREGALLYGNNGQQFQISIDSLGPKWICYPPVTTANAGADQLNVCASSVNLAGNSPSNGTATWSILSGAGGSLGTANAPATTFAGTRGNSYTLRYSITNACGSSSDTVAVSLAPTTTVANAGPDQLSLTGTTATLAANAPAAGETGAWSMVAGSGGSLSSNNNPSATFTKGTDSSYSLVWTITGPCGNSQDTVNLSFQNLVMNIPCPGISSVNYAGESYPTVQIGTQCWFAKNLNIGTMINSAAAVDSQRNNGILEKYCYNNDPANCTTYGGLYQWAEAVQYQNGANNTASLPTAFTGNVQGICPTGWHLPSDAEYCTLTTFLDATVNCGTIGWSGTDAGGKMKATTGLWTSPNTGATNSSGFSALPGGFRATNGTFGAIGIYNYFWSSSESFSVAAFPRYLNCNASTIYRGNGSKGNGFSARCLMDSCKCTTSTAGPDQLSLTGNTATLAANTSAAGETGAWSILSGSGGSLSASNNPTATFTKGTDSAYTLIWTITGPCGTSRDTVNLRFPAPVGTACGQAVTYAGESYPTVQIGIQCWFAKNLNIGAMIYSTSDVDSQTNNGTIEKYCYNNDTANCSIYGGLYQWGEAVQYQYGASNTTSPNPTFTGNVQGICPTGWHLPSDAEYCTLTTFLDATVNCGVFTWSGTDAGGEMKSISGLWGGPNTGATNGSGFSALPGGQRLTNGSFDNMGINAYFWSSSESSSPNALGRGLDYFLSLIYRPMRNKGYGFSARCLMDSCKGTTSTAGPDQLSLTGTTATLAANAPAAGETGAWSILSGSGGSLSANNNPSATFTKGTDSAYSLVWTITGPCGTSLDTVNLLFPALVGTACGQSVTYAGESYPTVQIGTQCWFAKNLNVGTMINVSGDQTNNSTLEKYCYNNDYWNCVTYGGLYQWAEAVQYQNGASNTDTLTTPFTGNVRGICPTGWHLPSDAEYCTLTTFLDATVNCGMFWWSGTDAGGKMKSTSGLWSSPNTGSTNSSGFSALPGGYRLTNGTFFFIEGNAHFWSSSESSSTSAIARVLDFYNSNILRYNDDKSNGFSARCLKD